MRWTLRRDRRIAPSSEQSTSASRLQRRGALAGLAVGLVGLAAKVTERTARAADADPLLLGRTNQADSRTQLDRPSLTNDTTFVVTNRTGRAIQAAGSGVDPASAGVLGQGEGVGVFGQTIGFSGIAGVLGNGRAAGVSGTSTDGIGVSGQGSTGVFGVTDRGGGNGVFGQGGIGGAGVFGQAAPGASGPVTYGVFSAGRFGATGPITALITTPDLVQHVVFDMASPDSLIVDVGSATLQRGRASVPLAPDFAAVIDTSTYQVFVTPYGPRALFVTRRTPTSFEVAALDDDHDERGNRGNIAFAYQVVGKRKDITVSRPTASASATDLQPTPPKRPEMPEVPELERPDRRDRDRDR